MDRDIRVGAAGKKRIQRSRIVEVEESLLKGIEIELKQAKKSVQRLETILSEIGDQLKWRRKAFTEEDKSMMDQLRDQGMTYKEIGLKIGRSESAVSKYLQGQGKGGKIRPSKGGH